MHEDKQVTTQEYERLREGLLLIRYLYRGKDLRLLYRLRTTKHLNRKELIDIIIDEYRS